MDEDTPKKVRIGMALVVIAALVIFLLNAWARGLL